MSVTPRPWTLSPIGVATNGFVSHGWPSTGTTSVCPERTTPPSVALPSSAGSVANRFALRRSSLNVSVASTPCDFRYSITQSINARFESRLVVSKPTSVRISGHARRSDAASADAGRTAERVSGAFMTNSLLARMASGGRMRQHRQPRAHCQTAPRTCAIITSCGRRGHGSRLEMTRVTRVDNCVRRDSSCAWSRPRAIGAAARPPSACRRGSRSRSLRGCPVPVR